MFAAIELYNAKSAIFTTQKVPFLQHTCDALKKEERRRKEEREKERKKETETQRDKEKEKERKKEKKKKPGNNLEFSPNMSNKFILVKRKKRKKEKKKEKKR